MLVKLFANFGHLCMSPGMRVLRVLESPSHPMHSQFDIVEPFAVAVQLQTYYKPD
jgi:hypothetical protein